MVKRKKGVVVRGRGPKLRWWVIDGFTGILALVICNFALYLLNFAMDSGFIEQLDNSMGYFGLNAFLEMGFSPSAMLIGVFLIFAISFILGMFIGTRVRVKKKR